MRPIWRDADAHTNFNCNADANRNSKRYTESHSSATAAPNSGTPSVTFVRLVRLGTSRWNR